MNPVDRSLLDTNVVILRRLLPPGVLSGEVAISAVTLAELSAGVHMVGGDDRAAREERASRMAILQLTENEFDPIPFGPEEARMFGRMSAAVRAAGRVPRSRTADLMIAATAAVAELPLVTTNSDDFAGLDGLLTVVAVERPGT